ncbi:hypothetical protein LOTGIDRAFT_179375 [Lottia gigantea]|uniref:Lipoma HMGIC fusion partner-like 2 protein n=1 Tax=Lottia gigantea TaxID=225164 RepID=V3ZQF5_LOTGI|nr:hypothetical protein LOTGIDRAFT_179375 [Lottia gigantea]ESO86572.1 hypothetical protein LOTGIDRAFT_179375 [Lottia gigantea]
MCYVIITCWSLLWTLSSISTLLVLVISVMSPQWLVSPPKKFGLSGLSNTTYSEDEVYNPTLGIFNRCTRLHRFQEIYKRDHCANFVTGYDMNDDEFPHAWKAALIFFSCAILLLLFTTVTSVISMCCRSLCGKSIFTVSGLIQSIAGLLCILGLFLYPGGWGTQRVKLFCGDRAGPFYIDQCSFGWSFYVCILATLLMFGCSVISIKADTSTCSRKVEEEVLEGKNLICVI